MDDRFIRDLAIAVISGLVVAGIFEWYHANNSGNPVGLETSITNSIEHPISSFEGLGNGPGGTYNHTGPGATTNSSTS